MFLAHQSYANKQKSNDDTVASSILAKVVELSTGQQYEVIGTAGTRRVGRLMSYDLIGFQSTSCCLLVPSASILMLCNRNQAPLKCSF